MWNAKPTFQYLLGISCAIALIAHAPSTAHGQAKAKSAAAKPGKDKLPKTLTGRTTGWPIAVTYFNSTTKDAPVLILLHDKSGNQLIWEKSAEKLRDKGFAVITVDLRKHGKSLPDGASEDQKLNGTDYKLMAMEDLEAVKAFLMTEHHAQKLNIRKLGIVAIGMSAPIALSFAGNDWLKKPHPDGATLASRTPRGQDVRAIAMLSPESSVSGVTTTKPLQLLQNPNLNVAMLFVVGKENKKIKRDVDKMFKQVSTNKDNKKRMIKVERGDKVNGTLLLSDRFRDQTTDLLAKFFNENLTSLDSPWRIRKSKLTD